MMQSLRSMTEIRGHDVMKAMLLMPVHPSQHIKIQAGLRFSITCNTGVKARGTHDDHPG